MIELSISSNSKLINLNDFLKRYIHNEKFILSNDEKTLNISLTDEYNIDIFYTQLSMFIFSTVESKLITKTIELLEKKELKLRNMEYMIEEEIFTVYINPIKILIKEHFKHNNYLNIESFVNFNCRGLKRELNSRYNDYMVILNQEHNNQLSFNEGFNTSNCKEIDSILANQNDIKKINDIFKSIKPNISAKIGPNIINECNTIHIRNHTDKIQIISNKKEDLINIIHSFLTPDMLKEVEITNDSVRLFAHILFCINILESNQIVFHRSLQEDVTSQVLLYLHEASYINNNINNINFLKCKGCNIC